LRNSILVTGGAGFIGSNFVLFLLSNSDVAVLNLDKLTYAGNLHNLDSVKSEGRHQFVHCDICDRQLVRSLFEAQQPCAVVHFAAESHVDRSILGPEEFIRTNITGTFALLDEARAYWERLPGADRNAFRFLHVSTDEVYGSLQPHEHPFTEGNQYSPNSPYAASKAAADHLVRSYHHTYGLPTLTSNCSNNYGPFQFPEKLIPLTILNARDRKTIPVYGDGRNVRDWLYVEDHCAALKTILDRGRPGETYNVGGSSEKTNLEVVNTICELLDEMLPDASAHPRTELIQFVTDRPGHDRRYAMDASKLQSELGWKAREDFKSGLRKTVAWYLAHQEWLASVSSGAYREWIELQYSGR
jgi:dTDP-glucose 4,6-dehydratase